MLGGRPLTTRIIKLVSEFRKHTSVNQYGNDSVAVVEVATEVGWSISCIAEKWVGFET